ncbi:PREDICTED: Fanconi anemia group D2 protein [Vollenhovia emeryi]|uniref:Fanconi anemia group D2 protein n=1 Tax=Vollenhovia emeryi TaxID=411798 RepID=UPI0005F3F77E|nr:PREDICTED: Fanconi anemia group D2 protein [Vollenhovia emeryi]
MDKRKLLKSSLHNMQPVNQSLERIDSSTNEQASSRSTDVTTQGRKDSFCEGKLSGTRSTALQSLNIYSKENSNSSVKNRKRGLCESENDMVEIDDLPVIPKISKVRTSMSKQLNSQASANVSFMSSQEENVQLSRNTISMTNKSLDTAGPSVEQLIVQKHKSANPNSSDKISNTNLNLPCNKYNIMKKKQDKTILDTSTKRATQDVNISRSSPKKTYHKSPIKATITESCTSRRKQKKPQEFQSSTESEKHKLTDKTLKTSMVNNVENFLEKQNLPSVFSNFLQKCGIVLSTDGTYTLGGPPSIVVRKMKRVINSRQYQKKDIIDSIEEYIRNEENFEKMLNDMDVCTDNNGFDILSKVTLARILLEVTEIQADIYNIFMSKLNESVLLADTLEEVPWAVLLLHQFRFLDTITDVDVLTTNIQQLLETCPLWFQQELILFLPDILSDTQHQIIAEILTKMLKENCELTNVILNCIASFNFGKEYLEEYKIKVLQLLKTSMKIEHIPIIIRFLLNDCASSDIIRQMLLVLRNIEMQPLTGDEAENYYKNQVQIVKTLKMYMLLAKNVTDTAITIIKDIDKNPKPLDLIILLLVFSGTIRQKNAEALLKQHIRSGFYRIRFLCTLYNDYKEVVRELQSPILQLTGKLLRCEERVFIIFATEWFQLQFLSQKETPFKQREIVKNTILLMGNNDQTMKHALNVLCKLANNTKERDCLVSHCNHLRILLEKVDCFGLEEVGTLSDLLHGLCLADNSTSESLHDDLFILLQKQLSTAKPITKCKGVMGAVMAIKHLAGKAETCDQALKLFNKVMKSVKSCCKSQPLFYDQLAQIIGETELNIEFVKKINDCVENEFVNIYVTDTLESRDDLVPKFGLNTENESQDCVLNFGNKRSGPIAPILFRLLKTCCMKLSEHEQLEAIDALLGCGMLMPQNIDIPESSTLDLIICCINWLREIISGFVTQTDSLLQKQVLKRLDTLIYLQSEFNMLLTLCDTKYQPPPCYFHYFPLPPFVKIERKFSKKGKKSTKEKKINTSMSVRNEDWEIGSMLCSKNPAYFRKFDAKIVYLLEVKIDVSSQSETQGISIKQVCFLVRELLAIFENEPSECFVNDLIQLLPKICSKLDDVVSRLRQDDNYNFRQGARLLLRLLTSIFNWKGFSSVTYNALLREGLRTLAKLVSEENATLKSCKELVTESYKYFESLSDIATEITLATALINVCQSIMKHSETYVQEYKGKHAKLAYSFLCLEWPEDKHIGSQYNLSVIQLLNNWIDNEPSPLDTVTSILEWLPDEVRNFENIEDSLTRMPSVKRNIFHLLYKKLFVGLINGINVSLLAVNSDPKRIKIWHNITLNVQKLVQICKMLQKKTIIQTFLRYMPLLIKQFLNTGMPILEHNLKYQTDDVTSILKMMQSGTRYLHAICCDCTEKKNLPLFKHVPAAKSISEKLIYSVKGMLVLNGSEAAFWMGNLVNKNLDGHEILSQTSSDETPLLDVDKNLEELANATSEILDSDLDENPIEETDDENDDIVDL